MLRLREQNPIARRLTGPRRWTSVRVMVVLALGIGLIVLAVGVPLFQSWLHWTEQVPCGLVGVPHDPIDSLWNFEKSALSALRLVAGAITVAAPLLVALFAAAQTVQDVQRQGYPLLTLTDVAEKTIVRGYVYTALYRMRGLLALVVGLLPALLLWTALVVFEHEGLYMTSDFACGYAPPDDWIVLGRLLAAALLVVGLWGMNLAGAAWGVLLALSSRHLAVAVIFAPLATLVSGISVLVVWLFATPWSIDPYLYFLGPERTVPLEALAAGVNALIPYLIGGGIMVLARRWARRAG